jgi:excisionase family DNA binding protein
MSSDGTITKHLTAEDLAQRLGISRSDIYEQVKRGTLPCLKIGRRVRFRLQDVERWEASHLQTTPQAKPTGTRTEP